MSLRSTLLDSSLDSVAPKQESLVEGDFSEILSTSPEGRSNFQQQKRTVL